MWIFVVWIRHHKVCRITRVPQRSTYGCGWKKMYQKITKKIHTPLPHIGKENMNMTVFNCLITHEPSTWLGSVPSFGGVSDESGGHPFVRRRRRPGGAVEFTFIGFHGSMGSRHRGTLLTNCSHIHISDAEKHMKTESSPPAIAWFFQKTRTIPAGLAGGFEQDPGAMRPACAAWASEGSKGVAGRRWRLKKGRWTRNGRKTSNSRQSSTS